MRAGDGRARLCHVAHRQLSLKPLLERAELGPRLLGAVEEEPAVGLLAEERRALIRRMLLPPQLERLARLLLRTLTLRAHRATVLQLVPRHPLLEAGLPLARGGGLGALGAVERGRELLLRRVEPLRARL